MKKTLMLSLLAGLVSTAQVKATDVYVTGSTAFRVNAQAAIQNLFQSVSYSYADTNMIAGGSSDSFASGKNTVWVIAGTPIAGLNTNITDTLIVHANFTGSVQGIKSIDGGTVPTSQKLLFLKGTSTVGNQDNAADVITNTATIAFSDVFSSSTQYPLQTGFGEDAVAVQPFVLCKSTSSLLNNVTNITWEQLKTLVAQGTNTLSALTGNPADAGTTVYLLNRTKDSGTRRALFAELDLKFNYSAPINVFYPGASGSSGSWTNYTSLASGNSNNVVGAAGYQNANYAWGPGYVGGGDIKTALTNAGSANVSIGYLSLSDAKGVTGTSWGQVIAYNGVWPTTNGPTLRTATTNDFAPIMNGQYPYWAEEVVIYPTTASFPSDQNIQPTQLGSATATNSFLGVLDYQSHGVGSPLTGSIEREIVNSTGVGLTAIPLYRMKVNHNGVGGIISPGGY